MREFGARLAEIDRAMVYKERGRSQSSAACCRRDVRMDGILIANRREDSARLLGRRHAGRRPTEHGARIGTRMIATVMESRKGDS